MHSHTHCAPASGAANPTNAASSIVNGPPPSSAASAHIDNAHETGTSNSATHQTRVFTSRRLRGGGDK